MKVNRKIEGDFEKMRISYMNIKVTACKGKIKFTIPAAKIREMNTKTGDYVKVNIKKCVDYIEFYVSVPLMSPSRTNLQVRKIIPKKFVKKTNLKAGDFIEMAVSKVENKMSTHLIKGYTLDVLAVIPEKTNTNRPIMVDLFEKNDEEYCKIWYCSGQGGNAKPIELKRYIRIDRQLGEFFGLMQAESRKAGEKFDFTNNLASEHKLFVDVAERLGIAKELWRYQVFYNPLMPKQDIARQVSVFKEILSINKDIPFVKSKTLSKVALASYINSIVLGKIMTLILLKLRARVAKLIETKELKEFAIGFICKDLLGDGTVVHNKANGKMEVVISEQDLNSQRDISQILHNLGIKTRIRENKINLQTDWNSYLWFIEQKAFEGHHNREKLLRLILNNYYLNKIFERIDRNMGYTSKTLAKKCNLKTNTAYMFLLRLRKRGFLENINGFFILNDKGLRLVEILNKAKTELSHLNPSDIQQGQL